MLLRVLALTLLTAVLSACAFEDDGAQRQASAISDNTRIKDQVLKIVCNHETRDVQRELVPVVKYARERDGRSDRVWEVADNADCQDSSAA